MGPTNSEAEDSLRRSLQEDGFNVTRKMPFGQNGVDIVAKRDADEYYIEVIGYRPKGSARSKDFYEAFFKAVARLEGGAEHCVLAIPKRFNMGMAQRVSNKRKAWQRIGEAFPELEIWLVDTTTDTFERRSWNSFL